MGPVGFIGVGQMGAPMAGHLVAWPGGLIVHDVSTQATAPLAEHGARVAASPGEVGADAELVSVMVRDDEQVRVVVRELLTTAAPGTVIAIHSTIRAETAQELAAEADGYGVFVIDAPVSGGFVGATNGTLALMVGGDEEAVARCREPFTLFASLIVRFGPAGAGTQAKLARNLISFASYAAANEAQRLAEAAGLDLNRLARVVRHSDVVIGGPGAVMFRNTTAPVAPGDDWYDVLVNTRALGEKDLALALELGRSLGVELPITELALERLADGLGVPH
ncbi:MAG: hypothetical protein QOJ67_2960 [Acidimicrobiaceae bacterium]|jgi:3-hydroxyisobutyrate dehydrogenase-like beta-hydroxyacid dehydrogenase